MVALSLDLPPPFITSHPWVHCNEVFIPTAAITAQKAFLAAYRNAEQYITSRASIVLYMLQLMITSQSLPPPPLNVTMTLSSAK